ncbi:hypothetical protein HKCCE3408_15115 [Rhodobacterales bacterium HKCCE3408]|nr:hypothetical protein [Rhodobacterales bacterium HKCCE3408]
MPGGTSSAVAHELRVVSELVRPRVIGLHSRMFKGDGVAPQLREVLDELQIELEVNPKTISADIVILQNPAFLKFQDNLGLRILCRQLFVVTHENFLRPDGTQAYDVAKTLRAIDEATVAFTKTLAPISAYNRRTVTDWIASHPAMPNWSIIEEPWFNICDFEMVEPTTTPQDRRGRLSRPGFEKFPQLRELEACFPKHAERNLLLGADTLLDLAEEYPHWDIVKFRGLEVDDFFDQIDFMVYFTSPTWRESFGRVLAEAIAAGKVVISDPETAATFDGAVIGASPADVDGLVAGFVAQPELFVEHVGKSQRLLDKYSPDSFRTFFRNHILDRALVHG